MEHDIVERIRNRTRGEWANQELLDEAADEIEHLRAMLYGEPGSGGADLDDD